MPKKDYKQTNEHRKNISYSKLGSKNHFFGKKHSLEARRKMSDFRKGKKLSDETIKKISESNKLTKGYLKVRLRMSEVQRGSNNSFFGKKHSEESKRKIGLANKGVIPSKETRKKISLANMGNQNLKGFKHSLMTRLNMSLSHKGNQNAKGFKHSEETKRKMSEARKSFKNPMFGVLRYGKDSANWHGGLSRSPYPYPSKWKKIKLDIKERDRGICQYCNKDGDRPHHINYNPQFNKYKNLILVCNKCNLKFNGDRDYWFAYWCFTQGIEPGELV